MLIGRPTAARVSRLLSEFGAGSASGCALLALDAFSAFLLRESTLVHHLPLEVCCTSHMQVLCCNIMRAGERFITQS